MDCIFCKIRDREIEKEFYYEDEDVMVFPDINPVKSIHLLVIPKIHIKDFLSLGDKELLFKIKNIIDKIVKEKDLDTKGFRVSINGGGAQFVNHLHFHVIGPMGKTAQL